MNILEWIELHVGFGFRLMDDITICMLAGLGKVFVLCLAGFRYLRGAVVSHRLVPYGQYPCLLLCFVLA